MRRLLSSAAVVAGVVLLSSPAAAQSGGQFEGFGGLTLGTTASASTFGGSVAVPFGDHLQIVGEGGRLSDIKSSLLDTVLDFTPLDLQLSAWYAEGGVRLSGSRHSAVRPYAEATAGFARLRPTVHDGGRVGAIANAALTFLDETEPLLGTGVGVILQGGPLLLDIGYRYKRIVVGNGVASALALGDQRLDVNQVRVGVGVRF
jgi:opacity protein-like surface antigen